MILRCDMITAGGPVLSDVSCGCDVRSIREPYAARSTRGVSYDGRSIRRDSIIKDASGGLPVSELQSALYDARSISGPGASAVVTVDCIYQATDVSYGILGRAVVARSLCCGLLGRWRDAAVPAATPAGAGGDGRPV